MADYIQEYTVVDDRNINYVLYYVNKFGGVDSLLIKGNARPNYANSRYVIDGAYIRNDPRNAQRRIIQNTAIKGWSLNTGLISDEAATRMDHLLLSPKVFLHDIEAELIYDVIITNSSFAIEKFKDNMQFVSYTIEVEHSQDVIRRG